MRQWETYPKTQNLSQNFCEFSNVAFSIDKFPKLFGSNVLLDEFGVC